jgi:hypothetical protein
LKLFSSFAYLACRSQILSQILDNTWAYDLCKLSLD